MTIRPMISSDYPAVDALMGQLHRLHVEGRPDLYVDMEHPYSRDKYESFLSDDTVIGLLAEEEGQVIGLAIASLRARSMMVNMPTAYLDDLIVDRPWRGRGIAKALFRAVEATARDLGCVRLDLMVWAFNEEALGFYRSMGMDVQRYILEKPL